MRWLRRLESRTIPFDLQFNLVGVNNQTQVIQEIRRRLRLPELAEALEPIDERMAQKIYNSIRDDVANYPKAGIAVSRFPTLSKFVNGNGTASE